MIEDKLLERFLRYVRIDTQSDERSATCPSTPTQLTFALQLADELRAMGINDVKVDHNGYLYATLPATAGREGEPKIGFIAHLDTSPDFTAEGVTPHIIQHYDGKDIPLDPTAGIILTVKETPELLAHKGSTIITTNGHTLLGADDKAGVAEIITSIEYLINHPEIPHGAMGIAFTPDEEIGRGADHFDVEGFQCQYAYTIDGGDLGELEYECFNAARAIITFTGRVVHPGYAKNRMVNAQEIALAYATSLPEDQTPATTSGGEGFYYLHHTQGDTATATLTYLLRDFTTEGLQHRKAILHDTAATLNNHYGYTAVQVAIADQYSNMGIILEEHPHIIERAATAMKKAGVQPKVQQIRGGTDGAALTFKGIPCPNLFAGGINFHGRNECIPLESMVKATQTIINIISSPPTPN